MSGNIRGYHSTNLLKDMNSQTTIQTLSWRRLFLAKAKLKASSRTSALLSGFAMVAMVEIDLESTPVTSSGPVGANLTAESVPRPIPDGLLIGFSVCTTLVVAVHLLALMISTCILPNIEAVSNVHNSTAVLESPHDRMQFYIELAWMFSTGLGILLFIIQIAILAWVRFHNVSQNAAIASTVIIVPVLVIFVAFSIHFYRQLITHKYERSTRGLEELESIANQLDGRHLPPV